MIMINASFLFSLEKEKRIRTICISQRIILIELIVEFETHM